jgi:hypothetical protein
MFEGGGWFGQKLDVARADAASEPWDVRVAGMRRCGTGSSGSKSTKAFRQWLDFAVSKWFVGTVVHRQGIIVDNIFFSRHPEDAEWRLPTIFEQDQASTKQVLARRAMRVYPQCSDEATDSSKKMIIIRHW